MNQFTLPHRRGEAPQVGETIPQLQFSDLSPDDIRNKLWSWAFNSFDDVTEQDTRISVPTSRAMWLDPKIPSAHEDAFMPPPGSREFCHMHLDGSIHAVVANEVEDEVIRKHWGKRHPLYHSHGVKEVIVYAPRDDEDLEVLKSVIRKSYEYATGRVV
ncbi:MAG: hypothetical protein ACI8P9_000320 [Parasphingorhabdus sp.]|jgi:hypothetical protein